MTKDELSRSHENVKGKRYARLFKESWQELETKFNDGIVNPQQENDVVCFIYFALATRFLDKKWPLHYIRTEDTKRIRGQRLRPDLNLNNRLFVEVKIFPLKKYGKGWDGKKQVIEKLVNKLQMYVKLEESKSHSIKERRPVVALWFWKDEKKGKLPPKDKSIDVELAKRLEEERRRYKKDKVLIYYGPKGC